MSKLTDAVLREVHAERERQDKKFGEDKHPSVDVALLNRDGGCRAGLMCTVYRVPTERRAKRQCALAKERGDVTWANILVEELSEAISATESEARLRAELVQVAAVAVSWIEAIDRRAARGTE